MNIISLHELIISIKFTDIINIRCMKIYLSKHAYISRKVLTVIMFVSIIRHSSFGFPLTFSRTLSHSHNLLFTSSGFMFQ